MSAYIAPSLNEKRFTCAACGTLAQQIWSFRCMHLFPGHSQSELIPIGRCLCASCNEVSFWHEKSQTQIFPKSVSAPMPHPDLPEACKLEYLEARTIASDSPRAAAALLRLCVQRLMTELGEKGKKIDDDIASLVSKGLPPLVQQALDICRVVGNNAVHPGEIASSDTAEIVGELFELLNFIVEQTIERTKRVQALYARLPQGAIKAIERRDGNANVAASPALQSAP